MASKMIGLALAALGGCASAAPALTGGPEQVRYFRTGPRGPVLECTFDLRAGAIRSVTGSLTVSARYDPEGRLVEAEAVLAGGATVRATGADDGRVRVVQEGRPPADFDAPRHLIVTSAPDWTDVFRICRSWDPAGPEIQSFPGLWIHPTRPPRRPTFTAERKGSVVVDGLDLRRLLIRLRENSAYLAWADPEGRMIKLVSWPATGTVLVREGFESAAERLRPE